jgi:hypothetical protein
MSLVDKIQEMKKKRNAVILDNNIAQAGDEIVSADNPHGGI